MSGEPERRSRDSDRLEAISIDRELSADRSLTSLCEFRASDVEAAFRESVVGEDRFLTRIGIGIAVALCLGFIATDVVIPVDDGALGALAQLRLAVGVLGMAALAGIWRGSVLRYDAWTTLFVAALSVVVLAIDRSRPPEYTAHFVVDGLVITALMVVFVTRFWVQVLIGGGFFVGLLLLAQEKAVPGHGISAISVSLACLYFVGGLLCWRLHASRRRQFAVAQSEQELRAALETLAFTDSLTGLSNRRDFMVQARSEFERYRRHRRPFCLLVLDLDHFKQINDRHGHDVGDEMLAAFGQLLMNQARAGDAVARLGGEEFALLLPEAELDVAEAVATRIRKATEELRCNAAPSVTMTVSIGVTRVRVADTDIDQLLSRADRALYAAKEKGRNRVISAPA
ncbi:MAG: diguanylate cyclase [Pseudomonadota bacterium]